MYYALHQCFPKWNMYAPWEYAQRYTRALRGMQWVCQQPHGKKFIWNVTEAFTIQSTGDCHCTPACIHCFFIEIITWQRVTPNWWSPIYQFFMVTHHLLHRMYTECQYNICCHLQLLIYITKDYTFDCFKNKSQYRNRLDVTYDSWPTSAN